MGFQISDYALSDTQGLFNPREAGERHGQIIERLEAEVAGLKIPAVTLVGGIGPTPLVGVWASPLLTATGTHQAAL